MTGPIIGLCFSQRKLGNTELMAKVALNAARDAGAEVELHMASRLDIQPCRGCLACVIKKGCPIDDDMHKLIEALDHASGLILACPTYFLTPSSSLKAVIDRFLMLSEWSQGVPERFAAVIGTAGKDSWAAMQLPLLNIMPLMLRMKLIGSVMACSPGPGETLMDQENVLRVADLGKRVAMATMGHEVEPDPVPPNTCPVCRSTFFQPMPDGRLQCPVCTTTADLEIVDGKPNFVFDPQSILNHRFTEERMKEHITEWVMVSGKRFMEHKDEIKDLIRPYRDLDYEVKK